MESTGIGRPLSGSPSAFAVGEILGVHDPGRGGRPRQADAPATEPDPRAAAEPTSGRSGFTAGLTMTAIVGGAAKGILVDRARVLTALPHARSQGKTAKWAAELVSGRITNDVVPITGGTLNVFGRTLTTRAWQHSYQASNAISLGLLGVGMLYGFPNLYEGWTDGGGVDGLVETRHGRTGVLATAGNLFQLGVMGTAFAQAPQGAGRFGAMLKSPLLSSGPMILASIAIGIPVTVNELGFLDFLNDDNDLSPIENAKATLGHHVDTVRGVLHLD